MYKKCMKRILDGVLAFVAMIILSWLFVIIALIVKITSKGPVLFRQRRIGIHKEEFNILKFRTMRIDTPKNMPTHLLVNPEQYITPIGRFLRKTSLDELPQLWNILIGQMAIVGPRPALWNQEDLIQERDKYAANDILPGLTGLAQINGRDELEIPIKAQLDGEYVKNITFINDVKIIWGTVSAVLFHKGLKEGGTGKRDKS